MNDHAERKVLIEKIVNELMPVPTRTQLVSLAFTYVLIYTLHFAVFWWMTNQFVGTTLSVGWVIVYIAMLRAYYPLTRHVIRWCTFTIYPMDFATALEKYKELAKD